MTEESTRHSPRMYGPYWVSLGLSSLRDRLAVSLMVVVRNIAYRQLVYKDKYA